MSVVSVAALGAAGLVLVVLAVVTARRPATAVPGPDEHLRRWSAVHDGIDPSGNAWVAGWLRLMYALGRPLARRGVQPDVVTLAGLWFAGVVVALAAPGGRWPLAATAAVVVGGVADGLDGCVATLTDRASAWGGVVDAVVDRLADLLLLAALVALGADVGAVVAGAALFLLEYIRARAGQVGASLARITVGERATRIVLVGVSLWCAGLFPGRATDIAVAGAWAVAAVAIVGCGQLLPAVRRALT